MCQPTSFFAKFLNRLYIGIFIWFVFCGAIFYVAGLYTFHGLDILDHIDYDFNTGCPKNNPMCGRKIKMLCYNDNMKLCYSIGAVIGMIFWAIVLFVLFIMCATLFAIKKYCIPPVNSVIDEKTILYDFSSNVRNETIK